MQTKYCIMPDEEKFFAFLSAQSFTESELLQLRLMHINQICVDETTRQWEVHFTCAAHLTQGIIQAAAAKLAAAFSLQKVDMLCDGDGIKCSLPRGEMEPQVEVTDCTGEPLAEELPLPPEPVDVEIGQTEPRQASCAGVDAPLTNSAGAEDVPLPPEPWEPSQEELAYQQAYEALYGQKKDTGLLWGRAIKGQVRKIDSIIEDEDNNSITLNIDFPVGKNTCDFTVDIDFIINKITTQNIISSYLFSINDSEAQKDSDEIEINANDKFSFRIKRKDKGSPSKITLTGTLR